MTCCDKLPDDISRAVQFALQEDIGSGDLTAMLIPEQSQARARVISREPAVLCGTAWFDEVFRQLDPRTEVLWAARDGDAVTPDQTLCTLHGNARTLLSGERTALNFLQTLSGTATLTRRYVDAVAGTSCRILDTRKTIPGLRAAQKYAVVCGGGQNHRFGLYDAILIKENHIHAAGSITAAIHSARHQSPASFLEVEVETLEQLQEALACPVDRILLDNMDARTLRLAVTLTARRIPLEASGSISLNNIRIIAETGVDYISIGRITKDIKAIDLSMRFIS
ncbi:MAG: nicotinate-nucleotide diphosphorylase (carboxylating) [Gammaproteobacteria bacterium RBG_16_57_12]|nr:MAG: nicotinate-nucleotide diphosphorylase (carboxylating) [Gammaproteobacteria bacterium RBG_16_57_12]